jgi:Tfp pilus assembly protein PilX
MKKKPIYTLASRQQGATLVIAMLILVLIMMIGITAVSTSNTQFKLAGNLQFEDGAMNSAETAVTTAENWLATGTNFKDAGFTTYDTTKPELLPIGRLASRTSPNNNPLTMSWSDTSSRSVKSDGSLDDDTQRYMIELQSTGNRLTTSSQVSGGRTSSGCNQVNTYLITSRGQSHRGATKFIQSFYSVLTC